MVMYVRNAQLESTCLTSEVQDQDLALIAQLDITHQIWDKGGVRFVQQAISKAVPDNQAAGLVLPEDTLTQKEPLLAKNAQLENTQKLPDKPGVRIAQWAISKTVPDNQAANLVLWAISKAVPVNQAASLVLSAHTSTWKEPLLAKNAQLENTQKLLDKEGVRIAQRAITK